jgi:hypothetical protein
MSTLVSGLYLSRASAEYAVDELIKVGFERDEISLVMSDQTRRREFAMQDGPSREDPAAGSAHGGVLEEVAAQLAKVERLGGADLPVVAAGPIASALSEFDRERTGGELADALIGLGIPENEASSLDGRIRQGRILVGVLVEDDNASTSDFPRREWSRQDLEEVERLA